MAILTLLYATVVLGLLVYGGYFVWLSMLPSMPATTDSHLGPATSTPAAVLDEELPHVTIQLPMYNEKQVAARAILAACAQDYPPERLQIQVLDDSTDDTCELVAQVVSECRQRGANIEHVRRNSRAGYKAGALAHGLNQASGEFVAVFDADFVPEPGWLRHLVTHFQKDNSGQLGLVQSRWRHLNAGESNLTRTQAAILDDYANQQATRSVAGLMPVFNGSCGLWRKECIIAAGGWSGNTLSEDLDLSYRAQLAGWTVIYDATILAAAELPASITSYKRQQYRWAKGPLQVTRLLAGSLLRSSLSWRKKLDALLFLTTNVIHLLLVLLVLLKVLMLLSSTTTGSSPLDILVAVAIAGLCVPSFSSIGKSGSPAPFDVLLQGGIALTGALGALAGLFGPLGGEFQRTPKSGNSGRVSHQDTTFDWTTMGDIGLLAISLLGVGLAIQKSQWFSLPILFMFGLGIAWVVILSLQEIVRRRRFLGSSR